MCAGLKVIEDDLVSFYKYFEFGLGFASGELREFGTDGGDRGKSRRFFRACRGFSFGDGVRWTFDARDLVWRNRVKIES